MRIERYGRRSRNRNSGCGCLLLTGFVIVGGVGLLAFSGLLLPLILAISGVERVGSTDSLFEAEAVTVPTPVVQGDTNSPRQGTLSLGIYGQEIITSDGAGTILTTGNSTDGLTTATASFNEASLLVICENVTIVCRGGDSRLRNVRFDLRPGGAIIYADAFTGFYWQEIGVVMRLTSGGALSFEVVGVDIDGITYNPETLPMGLGDSIGDIIRDVEREGNTVLRQVVLTAGGEQYRLTAISIDDTTLTLTLR